MNAEQTPSADQQLSHLYANRFDESEQAWKIVVWKILWDKVFARYVKPEQTVLDLGAGYCEFINAAVARRRIAVDLNPDTRARAAPGVEVRAFPAQRLSFLADGEVDVIFSSNFFEHLPSKAALVEAVVEARRVLRPGGALIAMGPNIRFLAEHYWDYFDHQLPLSDRSLCELLSLKGFVLEKVQARFLPYSVKSTRIRLAVLVKAYLALQPLSSAVMGRQFLVVARKPQ